MLGPTAIQDQHPHDRPKRSKKSPAPGYDASMKMLTAKVVRGQLDLPEGLLEEGSTVTVLIPEAEEGFDLSEDEVAFIRESMDQIARGDWVDGQQLLDELR